QLLLCLHLEESTRNVHRPRDETATELILLANIHEDRAGTGLVVESSLDGVQAQQLDGVSDIGEQISVGSCHSWGLACGRGLGVRIDALGAQLIVTFSDATIRC